MSPRKFLRNLRFLQILTQGNVVHRGRLFYLTATIFSRDPFDQVVKESGSNPDVVGSNPTTSRFFAPRGILCVDKIGSPEKPATPCWPLIRSRLIRWRLIRSPLIRTKPSPGEDRRVGWYCYRATQSRRSHLTYTHRKSSYRPKENIFWEKKAIFFATPYPR